MPQNDIFFFAAGEILGNNGVGGPEVIKLSRLK